MPIEEQMKLALEGGGMRDDGQNTDKVSGNDVPAGSLDQEVRDDVDAKLSEGEYVIPANVVRFIGLDKIEKMVNKAQENLQDMEANGRIGGEPVEDDSLPFDVEELASVEMAEGGVVPSSSQGGEFGGSFESRIFENDSGQRRSIIFINGEPIQQIPEGFYPVGSKKKETGKAVDAADPTESVRKTTGRGFGQKEDPSADIEKESPWRDPTSWEKDRFSGFLDWGGFNKVLGKTLGAVAGPLGPLVERGYKMRGNKAYEELQARIADPKTPEELRQEYEELAKQYEEAGFKPGESGDGILDRIGEMIFGEAVEETTPDTAAAPTAPSFSTGRDTDGEATGFGFGSPDGYAGSGTELGFGGTQTDSQRGLTFGDGGTGDQRTYGGADLSFGDGAESYGSGTPSQDPADYTQTGTTFTGDMNTADSRDEYSTDSKPADSIYKKGGLVKKNRTKKKGKSRRKGFVNRGK